MRILLVSNLFPPEIIGGYELVAYEFAQYFSCHGHEVVVATSPLVNAWADADDLTIDVRRVLKYDASSNLRGASRFIQSNNIAALAQIVKKFSPDRIFLFNLEGLGGPGIVTFFDQTGFTPVVYLGDNIFSSATKHRDQLEVFDRLFGFGDALKRLRAIPVSEGVTDEIEHGLRRKLNVLFHMPGLVPDDLPPLPERADGQKIRLVFSSRIAPHKGTQIMIDAVKHLIACGDTGFTIDVYGDGGVSKFMQIVHAEGLGDYIRYRSMLGRRAMIEAFSHYDALLFPTWTREPLGLVPFEAAAQGCIPIITAQAGAAEWLTSNDCFKIERDPKALAGAVQHLLFMTPEGRHSKRRNLATRIRGLYGAARWMPRILSGIEDLPDRRPAPDVETIRNAMFAITELWGN